MTIYPRLQATISKRATLRITCFLLGLLLPPRAGLSQFNSYRDADFDKPDMGQADVQQRIDNTAQAVKIIAPVVAGPGLAPTYGLVDPLSNPDKQQQAVGVANVVDGSARSAAAGVVGVGVRAVGADHGAGGASQGALQTLGGAAAGQLLKRPNNPTSAEPAAPATDPATITGGMTYDPNAGDAGSGVDLNATVRSDQAAANQAANANGSANNTLNAGGQAVSGQGSHPVDNGSGIDDAVAGGIQNGATAATTAGIVTKGSNHSQPGHDGSGTGTAPPSDTGCTGTTAPAAPASSTAPAAPTPPCGSSPRPPPPPPSPQP